MKIWTQNIVLLITGAVIVLAMAACRHNDEERYFEKNNEYYKLSISVSTIHTRSSQTVIEKIKSLRIIVVSNDTIELNTLIDIPNKDATGLVYNLIHYTKPGKKSFYLFGNEESVGPLKFVSTQEAGSLQSQNLSTLLNEFKEGGSVTELNEFISNVYFEPVYNIASDGSVYLPYTAYYGEDYGLTVGDKDFLVAQLYLVPVATKFIFNFTNYRGSGVKVNDITLLSSNQQSYLFAKVGDSNQKMALPESNKKLYWIDWLAEVSELYWNNQESNNNESFNEKYGWIFDYSIPPGSAPLENVFVAATESFEIPEASYTMNGSNEEIVIPSIYQAGPYYVPESINQAPNSSDSKFIVQEYCLTIDFEDTIEGNEAPPFENVRIPNLKALFRNTYVIIEIEMRQGDIEIYAQTTDWNKKEANGYVTENPKRPNVD